MRPTQDGRWRLTIDWTACDRRGLCVELLPELVGPDDWGYPVFHDDGWVPVDLLSHARRAARDCPVLALRLHRGGTVR